MKHKTLLAAAVAVALVAGIAAPVATQFAAAATEPPTQQQLGEEIFPAPGFDEMIQEGEETYSLSDTQRCRTGTILANDGPAVAKKDTADNDNVYLELKYNGVKPFVSIFSMFEMQKFPGAGDYQVSMRLRKHEGFVKTNNFGFRFWNNGTDSKGWASQINAAPVGEWFTLTEVYTVSEAKVSQIDSFSMWYDTGSNEANVLDMDDISIRLIIPEEGAPEVVGEASKVWNEESAADVTFELDLKEATLEKVIVEDSEYELEDGEYTFDAAQGILTLDSDYVKSLGEGTHTIIVQTTEGDLELVVSVYLKTATIPSTTEGYELDSTMLGGDFEDYEEGLVFSEAQTDEAWGSVALDDPGKIVDDNGNHVLRLGRKEGSSNRYASAFCMTSPEIALGDIVTLKFSYKFTGDTPEGNTNVSFVGAANVSYHAINLVTKPAKTFEGNKNVASWDIKYTERDGWTDVEMSFVVDFAFLNSTNSLRFLYEVKDMELYIDNVELLRWVEEGAGGSEEPEVTGAPTFNGAAPADVTVTVSLKEYNISSLKNGTATVASTNYALSENNTVLTIKKEYLATLANGEHTFTLTTLGGSCTFKVTVQNSTASAPAEENPPAEKDGGCSSTILSGAGIAGIVVVSAVIIAAVGVVLIKKKRS